MNFPFEKCFSVCQTCINMVALTTSEAHYRREHPEHPCEACGKPDLMIANSMLLTSVYGNTKVRQHVMKLRGTEINGPCYCFCNNIEVGMVFLPRMDCSCQCYFCSIFQKEGVQAALKAHAKAHVKLIRLSGPCHQHYTVLTACFCHINPQECLCMCSECKEHRTFVTIKPAKNKQ